MNILLDFARRNGEEHRRLSREYQEKETTREREAFFKIHGVRYTEFIRLPYLDIVRASIIDPMHNLLLGESYDSNDLFFILMDL